MTRRIIYYIIIIIIIIVTIVGATAAWACGDNRPRLFSVLWTRCNTVEIVLDYKDERRRDRREIVTLSGEDARRLHDELHRRFAATTK